jgi:hypothetical protein
MRGDHRDGLRAIREVHDLLTRLGKGTGPILVGPYLSEVGYELLYWIPFLTWAQATYGLDPSRLIIVSRGGCAAWYAHLSSRYLDVFSYVTREEFHRDNERPGTRKQMSIRAFDQRLVQQITAQVGPCDLLHPSLMYRTFTAFKPWAPESQTRALHRPMRPVSPLPGLPDRYVAVRFYSNAMTPDAPAIAARIDDVVQALAQDEHVVLVTSGGRYDDHRDLPVSASPRVHRVDAGMTPATNLEIQTRIVAGAARFVGTYGGFAYLAPLLGVPAQVFYVNLPALRKLDKHVPLARRVFASDPRFGSISIAAMDAPNVEYACA